MAKRILLFVLTNIAIVATLSIVLSILGVAGYINLDGSLNLTALAVFCFVYGMGASFISLLLSRFLAKRALGVKLVNGQTGNPDLDWLYATVERLARQANLPKTPEVGFYESPEVNAFATGPSQSRSLVAVSTGLFRAMSRTEVEAVLGHEISHVANGDMVTMTLLQGVVNAFVMFFARIVGHLVRMAVDSRYANLLAFVVTIVLQMVLGVLGLLIVSWFSRRREFRADAGGGALAGRQNMAAALRRLQQTMEKVDNSTPALASFKIAGRPGWMELFSSHPPLEQRIAALQGLETR
jgi:heat shock protein HtpX